MPRTPNAQALFDIGRNIHEVLLKEEGFKKRRNSWNREVDGCIQVITFWSGPYERYGEDDSLFWGLDHYGEFRIEIGLYIPEVNRLWEKGRELSFVSEPYCHIRTTIGDLMGYKNDFWLPIHADFTETVVYVTTLLRDHALPFFKQFETRENVKSFLRKGGDPRCMCSPRINLAVMTYQDGDKNTAQELLQAQHDKATGRTGHQEFVREHAAELGLVVNKK